MKPKRFFRFSTVSCIAYLVSSAGIGAALFGIVFAIKSLVVFWGREEAVGLPFMIIVCLWLIATFLYAIISVSSGTITLTSDGIGTKGDKFSEVIKLQYPAYIEYKNISTFYIAASMTASNGEPSIAQSNRANWVYVRPAPYLFVLDKRENVTMFVLNGMSRRTIRKLVTCLKEKCSQAGNEIDVDVDKLMKQHSQALFATGFDVPKDDNGRRK